MLVPDITCWELGRVALLPEKADYHQVIIGFRPKEQDLIYRMLLKEMKLVSATWLGKMRV
jgi:hypothetical protein